MTGAAAATPRPGGRVVGRTERRPRRAPARRRTSSAPTGSGSAVAERRARRRGRGGTRARCSTATSRGWPADGYEWAYGDGAARASSRPTTARTACSSRPRPTGCGRLRGSAPTRAFDAPGRGWPRRGRREPRGARAGSAGPRLGRCARLRPRSRGDPDGRWWATPATSRTRSPPTGSPTRCATPSCWPTQVLAARGGDVAEDGGAGALPGDPGPALAPAVRGDGARGRLRLGRRRHPDAAPPGQLGDERRGRAPGRCGRRRALTRPRRTRRPGNGVEPRSAGRSVASLALGGCDARRRQAARRLRGRRRRPPRRRGRLDPTQRRALVKLLALRPGRRLPREQVIDLLWPDLLLEQAAPRLHKAAHYARTALGVPGPPWCSPATRSRCCPTRRSWSTSSASTGPRATRRRSRRRSTSTAATCCPTTSTSRGPTPSGSGCGCCYLEPAAGGRSLAGPGRRRAARRGGPPAAGPAVRRRRRPRAGAAPPRLDGAAVARAARRRAWPGGACAAGARAGDAPDRVGPARPQRRERDAACRDRPPAPSGATGDVASVLALLDQHALVTLLGIGGVGKTRLAAEVAHRYVEATSRRACYVDLTKVDDPGSRRRAGRARARDPGGGQPERRADARGGPAAPGAAAGARQLRARRGRRRPGGRDGPVVRRPPGAGHQPGAAARRRRARPRGAPAAGRARARGLRPARRGRPLRAGRHRASTRTSSWRTHRADVTAICRRWTGCRWRSRSPGATSARSPRRCCASD